MKFMSDLVESIAQIRDSVVAVLRIHRVSTGGDAKLGATPPQFQIAIVGTAWCIVENRLLLTAHHVLNGGQPRDPSDRFFIFAVPQNGPVAYHIPVTAFPLEAPESDMAALEIAPPAAGVPRIPAIAVTFETQPDGQRVLTYGFPSPTIAKASVDANGNWLGGELFLKGHANEGIIAGQFGINNQLIYELNVGWHHGESGGPIIRVAPAAAFSMMQRYRNIQTPHGTVAGPHQGTSLSVIERALRDLGAAVT